eukprot:6211104-Alexandrium_andersonii.AAC.1
MVSNGDDPFAVHGDRLDVPLRAHGRAFLSGVAVGARDAAQKLLGLSGVPGDLRAEDHPRVPDPHAHAPG